ncbi:MAG: DoxX family protein [Chitinophagales bacterium]|nr:DoxX family protein [Chitinophagales bacterium]
MRNVSVYVMAVLYIIAGSFHFVRPEFYESIMPSYIPFHRSVIYISGILEIILGVLLIPKVARRFAAAGIIFLLIVVFPANIQMSINYYRTNEPYLWLTIVRLPLQFVLIWWAYAFVKKKKRLRQRDP